MADEVRYIYPLYHYTIGPEVSTLDLDDEDPLLKTTIVGIYSSRQSAEAALERVRNNAQFRDWPGGFRIYRNYFDIIASGEEGFISSDEA